MFINDQMVLYIFPHYVCTCVYMHTNTFWKVRFHLGCIFHCPLPLDCPLEESILTQLATIQSFLIKTGGNQVLFCCSHPDCVKLPHAENQSENVDLKN